MQSLNAGLTPIVPSVYQRQRMIPLDARIRVLALVAGLAVGSELLAHGRLQTVTPASDGETLDAAIRRNVAAILLERRGARVLDPEHDVVWLDAPVGEVGFSEASRRHDFVALAVPESRGDSSRPLRGGPGGPAQARDLFRLEARVTPYGVVYDDAWIVNLTQTADADEHALSTRGLKVATAVSYAGRVLALEVRDLAGEDPARAGTKSWGALRRAGDAITNLEQTGATRGLELHRFTIESETPPAAVTLRFDGDSRLAAMGPDGPLASVDLATHVAEGSLDLAYMPPEEKMQYDFLNWLADRGRGLSDQGLMPEWSGAGVELLKEAYFKAEEVKANVEAAVGPDIAEVEKEAEEVVEKAVETARFQASGQSSPWPPPPIEPMLGERVKGEGLWEVLSPDQVTYTPNAPPPFYWTFIRPDPDLPSKRIYFSVWDPELVSLKMRAGTTNPVPTTGNRGDGRIPRNAETLSRVVGGFNGGFQTAHIWYGMMVDKKVLLPPREWGATAGSWEDGRTVFATWPPDGAIPDGLTHYRQNLPPLIEDGVFNPYGRNTWGWHKNVAGAVSGKTIRTGLCYTKLGHVMYVYVEFADEHLMTRTLLNAGCVYAVHLDMNRGHSGFETYKRLSEGEEPKGPDPTVSVEGVRFEGHSLHPTNRHMKAPTRYLGVDYRDFFYLESRVVLPGADLSTPSGTVPWIVAGLPENAAFPPRFAAAHLPEEGIETVLAIDPRGVLFTSQAPPGAAIGVALGPDAEGVSVRVGDMTISGISVPESGILTGTVLATDKTGFVYVLALQNAKAERVFALLAERAVAATVYRPAVAAAVLRWYQPQADARLVEADLGTTDGRVVAAPTLVGPTLFAAAVPRPPAIVRLFPDTKPKATKRR